MIQTVGAMKDSLKKAADVRSTAKQHPLIAVGSAAAVGFIAGAALTPSPRMRIEKKLAELQAELACGRHGQELPPRKRPFLSSALGAAVTGVARTLIQSSIAAAIAPKDQPSVATNSPHDSMEAESEDGDDNGNGTIGSDR